MPHRGRIEIILKARLEVAAQDSEKIEVDATLRFVRVPTLDV